MSWNERIRNFAELQMSEPKWTDLMGIELWWTEHLIAFRLIELNWMPRLKWTELYRKELNFTEQKFPWNELSWNALYWTVLVWTPLNRTEVKLSELSLGWTEMNCRELMLSRTEMNLTEPISIKLKCCWNQMSSAELNRTEINLTKLKVFELSFK